MCRTRRRLDLAPSSGTGAILRPVPANQPTIVLPSIATIPPLRLRRRLPVPTQGVLSLPARCGGRSAGHQRRGLRWRVFAGKPDAHRRVQAAPRGAGRDPVNIVLPPGNCLVRLALGLVKRGAGSAPECGDRPRGLCAPAGGLRIEGRVGSSKDSAEPDFVRALQRQPVRRWRRRRAPVADPQRACRRCRAGAGGTYHIVPTTAMPTRWCAPTSASRPASLRP